MHSPDASTVLRFSVVAEDGRRSSDWRIWTGSRGRPSDDTYLTPRSSGGLHKVSLHKDGYCQHGPESGLRRRLVEGTRGAFDRWDTGPEVVPGWRVGYAIGFRDSELVRTGEPLREDVLQQPGPGGAEVLQVVVVIGEPGAEDWEPEDGPLRVIRRLERRSGGVVAVATLMGGLPQRIFDEARDILVHSRDGRTFPMPLALDDRFAWVYGDAGDDFHMALEIAVPDAIRQNRFEGRVTTWRELPERLTPPRNIDLCAVLYVNPVGEAELYVNDDEQGCTHHDLVSSARATLGTLREGNTDGGWDALPEGGYVTGLVSAAEAERSGRTPCYP